MGAALLTAIKRRVSPAIGRCELTCVEREPIDVDAAASQHRRYEACLARLGCDVQSLPAEPDLPDSVFVEDTAVVLDELAVISRPGAESRRPETRSIEAAIEQLRTLVHIESPGTLDGGDVLVVGREMFVGFSERTNEAGAEQLRAFVEPLGYTLTGVPLRSCLHLKSAVTEVARRRLLVNTDWVDAGIFRGMDLIEVDPKEPFAANALRVGDAVVFPARFVRTLARLADAGLEITPVEVSELAKAEGGVTCCSLIFEA
jgi:dimethylargininase